MPELLKIGFTRRSVEERLPELSAHTGVPGPFTIEVYFVSESPEAHEAEVFRRLSSHRIADKEFFRVELSQAVTTVETVVGRAAYYRGERLVQAERMRLEQQEQEQKKAERERAEQEWAEQEKLERERAEQEWAEQEKLERERSEREKAELEQDQLEWEKERIGRGEAPSPTSLSLQRLHDIPGVTAKRIKQLHRIGIRTLGDLLFHFPQAYEDLSDHRPITALTEGTIQTVRGEVVEIPDGRYLPNGRCVVSVVISDDGTHCVEGVWFNQPNVAGRFRYGQRVTFSGKPKWYRDHWQMSNPRVQLLDGDEAGAQSIVPVYPLTEDLSAERLRSLLRQAVERFAGHLPEVLPPELRRRHQLPEAARAIAMVHFPERLDEAKAGRRRFVYEEFLPLQLALALRRNELNDRRRASVLPVTPQIDARIRGMFRFHLTADQDRAVADVCRDLASDRPMQRLLQADVGTGKTAVAVYALLVAVANKHQAVLMAPTEVLARQHWNSLEGYLAQSRVRRLLLTGGLTAKEQREALAAIKGGEVDLVIGTQALMQEDVQFARLGLVVFDEQHKFGVNQRARVKRLGVDPHYLVMTATPIPRTMALTVFGDLDVSVMRQLPPGRKPVRTRALHPGEREGLYKQLREELRQGRQGYVVCPLVDESEALDLKAAAQTHEDLQAGPFHEFRVGLLHGCMEEEAKAEVMDRFRAGAIDLLVCTFVVEVGVDVPNATLMVVEHAERFGLSQLHQMRGRVSRGTVAGQCWVFAEPANDEARERLRAFTRLSDGFALAEEDARLRGDVLADADVFQLARKDAFAMVKEDAGLRRPEHAALRRAVLERYGKSLNLTEIE
jgi:ATP-dependent DNA helicase RecG